MTKINNRWNLVIYIISHDGIKLIMHNWLIYTNACPQGIIVHVYHIIMHDASLLSVTEANYV